jgi:hypothetical protein
VHARLAADAHRSALGALDQAAADLARPGGMIGTGGAIIGVERPDNVILWQTVTKTAPL